MYNILNKSSYKIFMSLIFISSVSQFWAESLLNHLLNQTLENNINIIESNYLHQSAIYSRNTMDGFFTPSLIVSSSYNFVNDSFNNTKSEYSIATINFEQPLSGGTTFGFSTNSENSTNYQDLNFDSEHIYSLSLNLSQSLLPFWIQGHNIKNPIYLAADQNILLTYKQLLYTKQTIIKELFQNYINLLLIQNQIKNYNNSISIIDKQIQTYQKLKESGFINQSKILELENSKWTYQQDLLSLELSFHSYQEYVKELCNYNFDKENIDDFIDIDYLKNFLITNHLLEDSKESMYLLEIEMLENNYIWDKQKNAPTLGISFQSTWNKDVYNTSIIQNPLNNWQVEVSLNLSPLFSVQINQNDKKYKLNKDYKQNEYKSYIHNKKIIKQQYQQLLLLNNQKLTNIYQLIQKKKIETSDLTKQYQLGEISRIELELSLSQLKNYELSEKIFIYM